MKAFKILLRSSIAAAVFAVAISCEPITNPEPIPVIDSTQTAIIIGTAYANTDMTNDTTGTYEQDYERAPANTIVKVVLDANDFSNTASPGQNLSYSTQVDGSGNFSIEVPALEGPIGVEVYVDSFKKSQTKSDGTQQAEVFEAFPSFITVTADMTTYVDVVYNVR
ncbi:MAG TPA: hypothetical protein VF181_12775 [Balneolaceae bacterium]